MYAVVFCACPGFVIVLLFLVPHIKLVYLAFFILTINYYNSFHDLSFKQRGDRTCYIIKYSITVLVLYDKYNQELEQTNGAESRITVRKWLVHIPDHSFQ